MKTRQCLFNSAIAIRKVFISNAAASLEARGQLQRLLLPSLAGSFQPASSSSLSSSSSQRLFSTSQIARSYYNNTNLPGNAGAPANNDRTLRDYDIMFPWIQLRQEDGRLSEPQRTSDILKKLDINKESLVLLAMPRTDESSKGPDYPVCRIVDRKAELAAQAEREARRRMSRVVSKELEINWATAPNDLHTKMTQLKKFLKKGYQVWITMMHPKKKDKRRASLEEAAAILKTVESTIEEIPGAKETRRREGSVGETLILLVHAPTGRRSRAETGTGSPEAVSTDPSSADPEAVSTDPSSPEPQAEPDLRAKELE
ncbi:hypothetical protein VTH06DRAFT_6348 [Thermothelomyces fergusii]